MAVLQVGICGAGVAGLAAAIALRRVGHDVEVSLIRANCLDPGEKPVSRLSVPLHKTPTYMLCFLGL